MKVKALKFTKNTDFTEISLFQGRRPILLKMSRPWNRELGWSLEIMQGTMPGARRRRRPRTAWMDNIKTWTGLPLEESVRMAEDRDKWRKYVHGVANPRVEDGERTEQNRTELTWQTWRQYDEVSDVVVLTSWEWRHGCWCRLVYTYL